MPTYRLRYFFDPGGGICLWSGNDAAQDRFGYPVDARSLPLPENTWRRVAHLCSWYDTSIDWNYPPDPSPWDASERKRFNAEAQKLLASLRHQLGADFEIADESGTSNPGLTNG
jgi:hypothetical protein